MIETTSYAEDVMTGSVVVARHVLITFDNRVQPVCGEEMSRMVSLLEWAKDEFGSEADLIVEDGDKKGCLPSTLVRINGEKIEVLRQGSVTV